MTSLPPTMNLCMMLGLIVCDGNSLTLGSYASSPAAAYPAVIHAATGADIRNLGVGNETTEGMLASAPMRVDPLHPNWVIAWEGTNSSMNLGDTPEVAYAALAQYVRKRQAAGARVAVMTTLPSPRLNEFQPAYNALVRGNQAGADAVVDVAADSRLQDPSDRRYFYADSTHLNDVGYAVVAAIVQETMFKWTVLNRGAP